MYFDVKLQTKQKTVRAVCFSPEKHNKLTASFEASSPVKISNYMTKRNHWTDEEEIHLNKRTKIEDPFEEETDFDILQLPTEDLTMISTVVDITNGTAKSQVNLSGRVTLNGNQETIYTKGKTLKKQEGTFTDHTGSMRIVFWENDIDKMKSGQSYDLKKTMVRSFNDQKYLTLNKSTSFTESDIVIDRLDDTTEDNHVKKVNCPAEGVQSLQKYLSCTKCQASVAANKEKKFIHCSACGLAQLKNKCKNTTFVKVLFQHKDENITLNIFNDKLVELYKLYQKEEHAAVKSFDELTDDDVIEFLLTVEATILYNSKNTIIAVKQKDE